ncbi:MAG: MATE family efflux transporter, partial [Clostridiales Family XIII bacterium]|nr:MATE family efflux transporter [Clostridiales Family XIII bacterium]
PISAQGLVSSSLQFVDNLIVGRLGETALATLGLSSQMFFIFYMILYGFTGGTVTYMSQFFGARDIVNVKRVIGITEAIAMSVGILFFIATAFFPRYVLHIFTNISVIHEIGEPFIRLASLIFLTWAIVMPLQAALRATQQTAIPFKISIIVFSTNTFLGIVLVYGFFGFPRCGIMGACYGILISRLLELSLYIIVIFGKKNLIAGKIKEYFSWEKELFKKVISNAIPTTVNELLWGAGFSMYNAAYGRISVTAFAAAQAGTTIMNIIAMACFAIGDATLILVGEKLGEGKKNEAYKMASRILKMTIVVGLIAGGLLALTSKPIISLFDFTPLGESYTFKIMMILSVTLAVKIFNAAIITGVLRAGGDTKFAMFTEAGVVWGIGVPIAFITSLYFHFPIHLAVLCVQLEEITKFFIVFHRFRSRKWVNTLV